MLKQFLLLAVIASLTFLASSKAQCRDGLEPVPKSDSISVPTRADAIPAADGLLDEIVTWLSSSFDLPDMKERPAIEFAVEDEPCENAGRRPCPVCRERTRRGRSAAGRRPLYR